MTSPRNYNHEVIETFRANDGKVPGRNNLLLLTTTGAKSGEPRIAPLAYSTDGDRLIIMASKGGAPTNPDWYFNLLANPIVTVEVDGEKYQAHAIVAEGEEHDRLFKIHTELMPGFADYQRNTERKIPVIILERIQ